MSRDTSILNRLWFASCKPMHPQVVAWWMAFADSSVESVHSSKDHVIDRTDLPANGRPSYQRVTVGFEVIGPEGAQLTKRMQCVVEVYCSGPKGRRLFGWTRVTTSWALGDHKGCIATFFTGCWKALTRHRLGYFRTHDCLGVGDPPPAISRTNGRIEPREAVLESSPRYLLKACLRF